MTIDLYGGSHARLRRQMHNAIAAARPVVDASDPAAVGAVATCVTDMLSALRRRANDESRILHPVIGRALPTIRETLDRQHMLIVLLIDRVQAVVDAFVAAPSTERAAQLSTAVRHFVAAVLPHIEEEEALVPLLAGALCPEELAAAARALAAE